MNEVQSQTTESRGITWLRTLSIISVGNVDMLCSGIVFAEAVKLRSIIK